MTVSLKHNFQSAKSDGPDSTQVQPSNWNAEHVLSCATASLLGRTTAATGPVEELVVDATLTLAAGSLGVTSGTYTTPAGTENLSNKTLTTGNLIDAGTALTDTGSISTSSPGFRGLPQNSKTANYTLALTDAGKMINITTGGVVIPANGSVAFPVGTTIVIYNNSASTQSITITTDTLRLAGTTSTGARTIAARGMVTVAKIASTEWVSTGNVS